MDARVNTIILDIDRISGFQASSHNVIRDLPVADVSDLLVNGHKSVSRNDVAKMRGRDGMNILIDYARPMLNRVQPETRRDEISIT
jgi:hypothetical protein